MHTAVKQAVLLYEVARQAHEDAQRLLIQLDKQVKKGTDLSQGDRADIIYCTHHAAQMFDDVKKDANRLKELLDNVVCAVHVAQESGPNKTGEASVRGSFALVTPDVKIQAHAPSQTAEPTRYAMLLRSLGVKDERTIEKGVLTFHWVRMMEYVTELAACGAPLPDGLDVENTKPKYATAVRKQKAANMEDVVRDARM